MKRFIFTHANIKDDQGKHVVIVLEKGEDTQVAYHYSPANKCVLLFMSGTAFPILETLTQVTSIFDGESIIIGNNATI